MKKRVTVYTDGACSGNPGPGGYGVILKYNNAVKELSGGERRTTNNRMELMGVIKALEALKEPCEVLLYTDSQYIVNAVNNRWAERWKAVSALMPQQKRSQPRIPICGGAYFELLKIHTVSFILVKGHAGKTRYNNRCDELRG